MSSLRTVGWNRLILAAALFLAVASPHAWAQSTNRDQLRRQDLGFVSGQLPALHLNFFFQLDPQVFQQAVQAVDSQIPVLTDAEFNVALAALAAMAGDPHTTIFPVPPATASPQFPLVFRWLDDGVFVTSAAPEYSQALGSRLVSVGNTPIDEVMQQLGTVIPHANQQWLHYYGAVYLRYQPILQGLDIVPATPASNLTFRTLAGQEFTLAVLPANEARASAPSPDAGPVPLYLQNSGLNYWFTYLAPLRLIYFKYNQCQEIAGSPFAALAANLLSTLDANPVDTLVIDFRGNTGGDSSVINPLINGLALRANALYANAKFVAYDVIDKGTFSSALLNAMSLRTAQLQAAAANPGLGLETKLVVIGEPTGGAPSGYGEVIPFTLPNSRLTGQYSTKFFALPPYIPAGATFAPDVAVPIRSTDFFARFDPVPAAIMGRSPGGPPAPSGNAIAVNGASFRVEQGLAPGSFASVFGVFPGNADAVLVNGQAGKIETVTASQINFVLPVSLNPGPGRSQYGPTARRWLAGRPPSRPPAPAFL
jgi:hypothetical protein